MTQGILTMTQIPLQFPRNDANDGSDGPFRPLKNDFLKLQEFHPNLGRFRLMFFQNHGSCVDVQTNTGRLLQNMSDLATGQKTSEPVTFPGSNLFESVVANSPVSRILSTARTLTDPRKSWPAALLNTLTGARLTDVPQRSEEALVMEQLSSLIKEAGAKNFENTYFSKDQLSQMTPEDRVNAMQQMALKSMFAKRQRERAKQAARNPSLQPQ